MSIFEQDVPAHHFLLHQQEISVLERETKSLKTKGRAELELKQGEEENQSEPPPFVKKEDNVVLKQLSYTLNATDSESGGKNETEKVALQPIKYDCQSEPLPVVQIEIEDICEKENQFVLKQETNTLMATVSVPFVVEEDPVELEPKQAKEEERGSKPQLIAKTEPESISENEIQSIPKQETDTLILRGYAEETDHQPEPNGNQTFFQNISEAERDHDIKTVEA